MAHLAWLIVLLPLFSSACLAGFGKGLYRRFGKKGVDVLGVGSIGTSFLLAACLLAYVLSLDPDKRSIPSALWSWFPLEGKMLDISLLIDPLSAAMALMVAGVGFLIHVYSTGYMDKDPGYPRYFSYTNLFMFAMLTLVFADNLVLFFLGWEGVGLCSYLLIGFWFNDIEKARAGMKAFIVNRIGDLGFLLGLYLLFWLYASSTTMPFAMPELRADLSPLLGIGFFGQNWATWVTLCFFIGATGKSAQIPLYVWLPDAMAGPTPVSALIHAATMVTAGVYMIARLSFVFVHAPFTLGVVATIGATTALFAATIGLCQKDIKKVLAYSTVSQLGYMFLAMGVGAFVSGFFHLLTHAFFKACLFLGAGSVIHGMHGEQNMDLMGGLRKKMPVTCATFVLAALAISGFPFFSGFFSKDEILFASLSSPLGGPVLWAVGLFTALLTAFYMFRLVFLTFFGESRTPEAIKGHIHESPASMTVPLVVLSILSVFGGVLNLPELFSLPGGLARFLRPVVSEFPGFSHALHESSYLEIPLMGVSSGVALLGIALAYVCYLRAPGLPYLFGYFLRPVYNLLWNKYYVDEIYEAAFIRPLLQTSRFSAKADLVVIDGAVNGSALLTRETSRIAGLYDLWFVDGLVNATAEGTLRLGRWLRSFQTGAIQNYLSYVVGGALLVFWLLWALVNRTV